MANNKVDNVDTRVVEMQFDNKQFEKGADKTLTTLEKLKNALKFENANKGFDSLQKSINSVSLDGLTKQVVGVESAFNTLAGSLKKNFFDKMSNEILSLGAQLYRATAGQIVSGGKTRAMNIAQAKFKMEGMNVSWDQIKDDLDYAVSGTAYGLDAAASIASQLVASGVEVGDSMKKALRGVSGVAAMTSSSYEEIGQVFAAVAGQGKAMAMQLNQLSLRGINAASTIAQYLGVTEAEVRELASQGKISFEIFSEAMDEAFGEHAKEANKTFTGAASNIRAALSKIGEIFYSPFYDAAITPLNTIRETISMIKDGLVGGLSDMDTIYGIRSTAERINQLIHVMGDIITIILSGVQNGLKRALKFLRPINKVMVSWLHNLKEFRSWLQSLGGNEVVQSINQVVDGITNITDAEKQMAWDIWNKGKYGDGIDRINALGKSYKNVQTYLEALIRNNFDTAKTEEDLGIYIKKTTEAAETQTTMFSRLNGIFNKLKQIAAVVSSVISHAADRFKDLISIIKNDYSILFGKEANDKNFADILNDSLNILLRTIDIFYKALVITHKVIYGIVETIGEFIKRVDISGILKGISNALDETVGKVKQADIVTPFVNLAETLSNLLLILINVGKAFGSAFSDIFDLRSTGRLSKITEYIKQFSESLVLTENDYENLVDTFKGGLSVIKFLKNLITGFIDVIGKLFPEIENGDSVILKITGTIGRFLTELEKNLEAGNFFSEFAELVVRKTKDILRWFKKLTGFSLSGWFKELIEGIRALGELIADYGFLEGLKKFKETSTILSDIWDSVSSLVTKIINGVASLFAKNKKKEKKESILDPLKDTLSTELIPAISKFIEAFSKIIAKYSDMTESFADTMTEEKAKKVDKASSNVASTSASITGAIKVFETNIEEDVENFEKITKGISKIASSIAVLAASIGALNFGIGIKNLGKGVKNLSKTFKSLFDAYKETASAGKIKALGEFVLKAAVAIVILGAAVLGFAYAIKKLEIGNRELIWSVSVIGGLIVALSAFLIVVSKLTSVKILASLGAVMVSLDLLIVAIFGISIFFAKLESEGKLEEFTKILMKVTISVLALLSALLLVIGGFSSVVSLIIGKQLDPKVIRSLSKYFLGIGAAMVSFTLSTVVLTGAMILFALIIEKKQIPFKSLVLAAGSLVIIMGALTIMIRDLIKATRGVPADQIRSISTLIKSFSGALSTMLVSIVVLFAVVLLIGGVADMSQSNGIYVAFVASIGLIIGIMALMTAAIHIIITDVKDIQNNQNVDDILTAIMKIILAIAAAMIGIVVAIAILNKSLMDGNILSNALSIVLVISLIGWVQEMIDKIAHAVDKITKSAGGYMYVKQLKQLGNSVATILGSLSILAIAVGASVAMMTKIGKGREGAMGIAAGIIAGLLVFVGLIIHVIVKNLVTADIAKRAKDFVAALALFMISFSSAIILISVAMSVIEEMRISDRTLKIVGGIAVAVVAALAILYGALYAISKTIPTEKLMATATTMVNMMVATFAVITVSLLTLTLLPWDKVDEAAAVLEEHWLVFATILGIFAALIVGALSLGNSSGGSTAIAGGAELTITILEIATSILVLAAALAALAVAFAMLTKAVAGENPLDIFNSENTGNSVENLANEVKTWSDARIIKDVHDHGVGTGEAYAEGIQRGLWDNQGNLTDAGYSAGGAIVDGTKNILEIHSPSKVGYGIGQNFASSIANGMRDKENKLTNQARRMGAAMSNELSMALKSSEIGEDAAGTMLDSMSTVYGSPEAIEGFGDFAFDKSYGDIFNDAPAEIAVTPVLDSDTVEGEVKSDSIFDGLTGSLAGVLDNMDLSMSGSAGFESTTGELESIKTLLTSDDTEDNDNFFKAFNEGRLPQYMYDKYFGKDEEDDIFSVDNLTSSFSNAISGSMPSFDAETIFGAGGLGGVLGTFFGDGGTITGKLNGIIGLIADGDSGSIDEQIGDQKPLTYNEINGISGRVWVNGKGYLYKGMNDYDDGWYYYDAGLTQKAYKPMAEMY